METGEQGINGMMEQPREPIFYPDEEKQFFFVGNNDKTLQSINSTLKRIEVILLELKSQFSVLDGYPYKECYGFPYNSKCELGN